MQDHATIDTARLRLVPVREADAADLHRIYADPVAMTYWHTPPHASLAETTKMIGELIAGNARGWALIPQESEAAIGLVYYLGEARPGDLAMGYILRPDHWRQGYMLEAAGAVIDYGFAALGMDRAELWIDARNLASRGLARALGFTRRHVFCQQYPHAAQSHETYLYGMEIEQWEADAAPRQRPPVQVYGMVPILPAQDVRATAEFYRDKLGFSVDFLAGDPPGYGGVTLGAWSVGPGNIHFRRAASLPPRGSISLRLNIGPGIDTLHARYLSAGVEIVSGIATQPWGQRDFTIADCNGHHLCFSAPEAPAG